MLCGCGHSPWVLVAENCFICNHGNMKVNTEAGLVHATHLRYRENEKPIFWHWISKTVFHAVMASCPSAPRDTPVAAINTEEKLLEDFQRDSHPDKVCLACRGEWRNRGIDGAREPSLTSGAVVHPTVKYIEKLASEISGLLHADVTVQNKLLKRISIRSLLSFHAS